MDNRNIFIIGNGFDLSHGIESGYRHFVNWTISDFFQQFQTQPSYWGDFVDKDFSNEFIYFRLNYQQPYDDIHFQSENCKFYEAIPRILSKIESLEEFRLKSKEIEDYLYNQVRKNLQSVLKCNFEKNLVFKKIIEEYDKNKNWVDIEKLYFNLLMKGDNINIETLNSDFEVLKNKFEEYLKSLNKGKVIKGYKEFFSKFKAQRNTGFNLILNFNYTNTFKQYIPDHFQVINIHGELDNEENKIIFGYGDYESEDYKKLEALDDNRKLKHIKLFNYNLADNYEKLTLRLGQLFSVHILGHSCGLSDRGVLRDVLNRFECDKIYIYYYEYESNGKIENDFTDKVQNLSRCFENKQEFIRKINKKDAKYKMPQAEKKK